MAGWKMTVLEIFTNINHNTEKLNPITMTTTYTPTTMPRLIKTIQSPNDYWAWWYWLENKGKQLYGADFQLYERDAPVILKLLIWSLQDKEKAKEYNIHLHKGIMLTGPKECGKTSLMNLINHIPSAIQRYTPIQPGSQPPSSIKLADYPRHRLMPCREVALEYTRKGYDAIQRYTKQSFNLYTGHPFTICFDDLGQESPVRYHKAPICNTMAVILVSRYQYFLHNGMVTHITTSLSNREIEEKYGKQVKNICRELFNVIAFDRL